MGVWREIGFIYTFKNHADNFLHQLVRCGRDAQRPFLAAVFLGDVLPSGRMRLIAVVFERCDDFLNALITHTINGFAVRSRGHISLPGADVVIGTVIELRIIEIAVKSLESIRFITRFLT